MNQKDAVAAPAAGHHPCSSALRTTACTCGGQVGAETGSSLSRVEDHAVGVEGPDFAAGAVEFCDPAGVLAGDQGVAVGQAHDRVGPLDGEHLPLLAVRIEF